MSSYKKIPSNKQWPQINLEFSGWMNEESRYKNANVDERRR